MGSRKIKNVLAASFLGLALIPWLPWSCQTRPAAPPPPPPPNYFDLGEKYFDAGDYAKAAEAYNLYLQNNSAAENQDRALFRLALAYALPASPVRDLPRATETLQGLVQRFPQSPYTPQAEFLLQLQTETDQLRAEVQQREAQLQQLHEEVA
ncbi:MAG: outer membrane protein assembly factor BamD, partial [Acidobacteria bacterium]|nr:outer membrane protein assembly factor BamD [Acidobacteriota bacterium]